ncbi:hypothetical protein [Gloeocapsa sp. PCC 73106]|uniref:hypothetical protein n=1 Tax=Gloeocapsa sp. PCC 73106 TaxID=102232 RepID=UPI0002AB9E12|nr:hypothetical protein [Gloeocapsa sp. PCC 73106]ELR97251.1 hypothetical protein GLO73106DRAFT_00010570 [Gloeocapsa sp. PCC 73106]
MTNILLGFAVGLIVGVVFVYLQKNKLQDREQQIKKIKQESHKKVREVERENDLIKEDITTLRLEKEHAEQRLATLTEDQQAQVQQIEESYQQRLQELEQSYQNLQNERDDLVLSYEDRIEQLRQMPAPTPTGTSAIARAQIEQNYQDQIRELQQSYQASVEELQRSYDDSQYRIQTLEAELESTRQDYEERLRVVAETPYPVFTQEATVETETAEDAFKETIVHSFDPQATLISQDTEIYTQEEIQQAIEADRETMIYPLVSAESVISSDTEIFSSEQIQEMLQEEEPSSVESELSDPFGELITVEELQALSTNDLSSVEQDDPFSEVITSDDLDPFALQREESSQLEDLFLVEEEQTPVINQKRKIDDMDLLALIGDEGNDDLDHELSEFMSFSEDEHDQTKKADGLDLFELLGEDDSDSDDDFAKMFGSDDSVKEDLEMFSDLLDEDTNKK